MSKTADNSEGILSLIASGTLFFFAGLCLIGCPSKQPPEQEHKTRPFYMGFTPFPWDMTAEAAEATNKFIVNNGDIIAHHLGAGVPWPEALEDKPFDANLEKDWRKDA